MFQFGLWRPASVAACRRLGLALGLAATLAMAGSVPADAGWLPVNGQRFDLQLSAPFDLIRPTNILALGLFATTPERVRQLRAKGVAVVCQLTAGLWENWRPDAPGFPAAALGRSPTGWTAQRWLDIREPAVRPLLAARLDLCRDRGFDGVLLADLDGYAQGSGFALTPAQQLEFDRWLAAAAHARGMAVGLLNDLAQAAELAPAFDFLVADGCMPAGGCGSVRPFLAADKPVFLIAYTNQPQRMDAYCAAATAVAAPLIFKTQSLNGKLHHRCV